MEIQINEDAISEDSIVENNRSSVIPTNKKNSDNFQDAENFVKSNSSTSFRSGSNRRSLGSVVFWSWTAISIDLLLSVSLASLLLLITNKFVKILDAGLFEPVVSTSFFIYWLYSILFRVFLGYTMGEYACYLRLGQPSERFKSNYKYVVFVRETMICLTGIVLFPVLFTLFRRDFLSYFLKIKIISLL